MRLNRDHQRLVDEFKDEGWTVSAEGKGFVATHPDAKEDVRFGGPHGWVLRRIRDQKSRALGGKGTRINRNRLLRQEKKQERAALRQEWNDAAAAHRRGDGKALYEWAHLQAQKTWRPTKHFAIRQQERRISREDVADALLNPVFIDFEPRDGRTLPLWYGRKAVVVADMFTSELVTCYRADKYPPKRTAVRRPKVVAV